MKILLAVDGSLSTKRAMAYLAGHQEWLGKLHALPVFCAAAPFPHRASALQALEDIQTPDVEEAESVLQPVCTFFATQGIKSKCVSRVGSPAKPIAQLAEKRSVDLAIMGAHGHGAMAGLVMGRSRRRCFHSARTLFCSSVRPSHAA